MLFACIENTKQFNVQLFKTMKNVKKEKWPQHLHKWPWTVWSEGECTGGQQFGQWSMWVPKHNYTLQLPLLKVSQSGKELKHLFASKLYILIYRPFQH